MGDLKDKVEGTIKENVGKATGDDQMQTEGQAQDTWGHVQGAAQNVRDKVGSALNDKAEDAENTTSDKS